MLIEDSKFIRIASQRELIKAGYTILMAADGEHVCAWPRKPA